MLANPLILYGAGAENRTRMTVRSEDFESSASTSFTTPAFGWVYSEILRDCQ